MGNDVAARQRTQPISDKIAVQQLWKDCGQLRADLDFLRSNYDDLVVQQQNLIRKLFGTSNTNITSNVTASGTSGGITGSLTPGYMPAATGIHSVGNGPIYTDGARIGVGMVCDASASLALASIPAYGSAATVFLTSVGGVIQSRTAAQVLSDGGAFTGSINTQRLWGRGTAGTGAAEQMVLSSGAGLTYAWGANSLSIGQTADIPQFAAMGLSMAGVAGTPLSIDGTSVLSPGGNIANVKGSIAHGMTDIFPTTTTNAQLLFNGSGSTFYGLNIRGVAGDTVTPGIRLEGHTNQSTPYTALLEFAAWKANGTTRQAIADTEIIASFLNGAVAKANIYGNGDLSVSGKLGVGVAADSTASLKLNSIPAYGSPATVFLTSVGGVIQSRTAAQVLSDGGAFTGSINTQRLWGRGTAGTGAAEQMALSSGAGLTYAWGANSLSIGQTADTPQFARIGIGAAADANIPLYAAGNNYVAAAFGNALPIYAQYYNPIIGFNIVSDKFGLGSSANYAGRIGVAAASTGTMYFDVATAAGNAGATASMITALSLDKNGNAEIYGTLKVGGVNITPTSVVDYTATSTITGWSSISNKYIYYKKDGPIVRWTVYIYGTGTGTSVSFTLPFRISNDNLELFATAAGCCRNDATEIIGACKPTGCGAGSSTISVWPGTYGTNWTTATTRGIKAEGWYFTSE